MLKELHEQSAKCEAHRLLLKMNTLFANKPPLEALPENIEDFNLRWIWRGLFYVIEFRKSLASGGEKVFARVPR